jgi:two-component system, response regulator
MSPHDFVEILLVEDNPLDAELTIRAFRKRNLANNLHHVTDGEQAVSFFFANPGRRNPRVVLLDIKLPKLSGLEVLQQLRDNDQTRSIPVVMLTSSSEDRDLQRAYSLGANSYIVKPVNFENFAEAVGQLGMYWVLLNHPPPEQG